MPEPTVAPELATKTGIQTGPRGPESDVHPTETVSKWYSSPDHLIDILRISLYNLLSRLHGNAMYVDM